MISLCLKLKPVHCAFLTATRNMATRLFEGKEHANLYATYRPSHTENVYSHIIQFYDSGKGDSCKYNLAVDVGCGSGQSSRPLCRYFQQVIGYDVSPEQIKQAKKDLPNLSFKVGPGEKLDFLEDSSTDLITLASAIHWLDLKTFFPEVKRVLKPGGVLAAYAYGNISLDDEEANKVRWEFYEGLLRPYWDEKRLLVDELYASITLPFEDRKRIESEDVYIYREMPVDALVGYLSTWSGWQTYLKQHPDSKALEEVRQRFKQIYGDRQVKVTWPVVILLGRKPE